MSKDASMTETKPVQKFIMPLGMQRPPLDKWIAEEREKKWKEHIEEMKDNTKLGKKKKKSEPEYMIPFLGMGISACILAYSMSGVKKRKMELPNYLIYTRLAVQGTFVVSLAGLAFFQSLRFVQRKYFDEKTEILDVKKALPQE